MRTSRRASVIAFAFLTWAQPAGAHGIAGNRYFDGTLTFDDPAVADEAILPYYTSLAFPVQGSNVVQNSIDWSFARLLTRHWQLRMIAAGFTKTGPWATPLG
jgi:hypothetical protein